MKVVNTFKKYMQKGDKNSQSKKFFTIRLLIRNSAQKLTSWKKCEVYPAVTILQNGKYFFTYHNNNP